MQQSVDHWSASMQRDSCPWKAWSGNYSVWGDFGFKQRQLRPRPRQRRRRRRAVRAAFGGVKGGYESSILLTRELRKQLPVWWQIADAGMRMRGSEDVMSLRIFGSLSKRDNGALSISRVLKQRHLSFGTNPPLDVFWQRGHTILSNGTIVL